MARGKGEGWMEEGRTGNGETSAIVSSTTKIKGKKEKNKNNVSGSTRNQELWQL